MAQGFSALQGLMKLILELILGMGSTDEVLNLNHKQVKPCINRQNKAKSCRNLQDFNGADGRIRTGDLILTKDALYLLSYISAVRVSRTQELLYRSCGQIAIVICVNYSRFAFRPAAAPRPARLPRSIEPRLGWGYGHPAAFYAVDCLARAYYTIGRPAQPVPNP